MADDDDDMDDEDDDDNEDGGRPLDHGPAHANRAQTDGDGDDDENDDGGDDDAELEASMLEALEGLENQSKENKDGSTAAAAPTSGGTGAGAGDTATSTSESKTPASTGASVAAALLANTVNKGIDGTAGGAGAEGKIKRKREKNPLTAAALAADADKFSEDKWEASLKQQDVADQKAEKALAPKLTSQQHARHMAYLNSTLPAAKVKRMVQRLQYQNKMPATLPIAIAGIAKLFVGDIVEMSREVMARRGDTGPIRPVHMREALRILQTTHKIPGRDRSQRLFRR